MKYKITEDYIYIQHDDNKIEGIPLKTLSKKELVHYFMYLAENGEYSEDIKLELKFKKNDLCACGNIAIYKSGECEDCI